MNKSTAHTTTRYLSPGWFTRNVMNRAIRGLVRCGVGIAGSRELRVKGRTTGEVRTTVVNVLDHDGQRFLVAPRGETQWVRNVRAAGSAELRLGRRIETIDTTELADAEKAPILRAYVERWRWEVGQFFEGLSKHPTDDELEAIAPGFPVFSLS